MHQPQNNNKNEQDKTPQSGHIAPTEQQNEQQRKIKIEKEIFSLQTLKPTYPLIRKKVLKS